MTHPRFERGTTWLKVRCSTSWANGSCPSILPYYFALCKLFSTFSRKILAGVEGFEPSNVGARIQCLTAWRHPIVYSANIVRGHYHAAKSILSAITLQAERQWVYSPIGNLFAACLQQSCLLACRDLPYKLHIYIVWICLKCQLVSWSLKQNRLR